MPTLSGKTFVGAELIRMNSTRNALFLVPKIDLVEQQAGAIETWMGDQVQPVRRYHGGLATPSLGDASVLVSTPAAFGALQSRDRTHFGWHQFDVVIFDEVHHVLKQHPYRNLALSMPSSGLQVVGLSASLTYAVTDQSIQKVLERLCHELRIQVMSAPSSHELVEGGYVPRAEGTTEIVNCDDCPDGVVPLTDRKPHLLHQVIAKRILQRTATPFTLLLSDCVNQLEKEVTKLDSSYSSPLQKGKLSSWEDYVSRFRRGKSGSISSLLLQLENLFVALRLMFVSWEEEEGLTTLWLSMTGASASSTNMSPKLQTALELLDARVEEDPLNFSKLHGLINQLHLKKSRFGESFRCIVFVQQRISAYILSRFINQHGFQSGFIAARGSPITASLKVSSTAVKTVLQDFRSGKMNVMVATSVAEEVGRRLV